jgi:hypothetical protein
MINYNGHNKSIIITKVQVINMNNKRILQNSKGYCNIIHDPFVGRD